MNNSRQLNLQFISKEQKLTQIMCFLFAQSKITSFLIAILKIKKFQPYIVGKYFTQSQTHQGAQGDLLKFFYKKLKIEIVEMFICKR
ncbi:unnamed protein product [Paramecium octaurelia]|uniref:Uncharacterized protein n=1 Tax=Paramecium octaurelia TaxID=43137 RepID=A0A8S1XJ45_PAROT|nr:unnamed protein product [Paramecium octaurelia]